MPYRAVHLERKNFYQLITSLKLWVQSPDMTPIDVIKKQNPCRNHQKNRNDFKVFYFLLSFFMSDDDTKKINQLDSENLYALCFYFFCHLYCRSRFQFSFRSCVNYFSSSCFLTSTVLIWKYLYRYGFVLATGFSQNDISTLRYINSYSFK